MQREDWHINLEPTPGGLHRLRDKIRLDEDQLRNETRVLKACTLGLMLALMGVAGSFIELKPQTPAPELIAQQESPKDSRTATVKLVDMEGTLARATSPGKKVQIFFLSPAD